MRYASIRSMDISNGKDIGVSLFVQGCHFHCDGCFNKETWDFNGGKPWTIEEEESFMELISPSYIKRVSILGGEPLTEENLSGIKNLVSDIRMLYGDTKAIWLYTGYKFEDICKALLWRSCYTPVGDIMRFQIIKKCDVLVDGRYEKEHPVDFTQPWFGSTNQRVIDIKKTMETGEIKLFGEED